MPGGQAQKKDPGVFVQLATGWHPPFWTWHSSKSINLSKMEQCQGNNSPKWCYKELTVESTDGRTTNIGLTDGQVINSHLPEQFFPSPVKPVRQKQEWLPIVLTHLANSLHCRCPVAHSFTSISRVDKKTKVMRKKKTITKLTNCYES